MGGAIEAGIDGVALAEVAAQPGAAALRAQPPPTEPPDREPEGPRRAAVPRRPPEPPKRGVPLGVRLGITIAVVVTLVLGAMTAAQLRAQVRRERGDREALLAESLVPVGAALEQGMAADRIVATLAKIAHDEATGDGRPVTVVRDGLGATVAQWPADGQPTPGSLSASIAVRAPGLPGGRGVVSVWQADPELAAEIAQRWRSWWLDLAVASLCVVASVLAAVYVLVTRPLGRLVDGLSRLEAGHLGELDVGRGAWEIKWLAWRFHRLGFDLAESARRLVAAERMALLALRTDHPRRELAAEPDAAGPVAGAVRLGVEREMVRRYLAAKCRLLEASDARDLLARAPAVEAWEYDVVEAERLGDTELRARLENAALRILHPDEFARVGRELRALLARRKGWSRATAERLAGCLSEDGLEPVRLEHRVKHVAGIWRKMEARQIGLEEVHDLFAFRVVVPEERDCYLALHAVHRVFEPEPFRFKDYIAEPKSNGYRSLHTTVRGEDGAVFEVQIRSLEMHRAAETGDAAHWRYTAERPRWRSLPVRRSWWLRTRPWRRF